MKIFVASYQEKKKTGVISDSQAKGEQSSIFALHMKQWKEWGE